MNDDTKVCNACKLPKPLTDFYIRSNGYPVSECKACMKARNGKAKVPKTVALVPSEQLLIRQLGSLGIPSYPGKAISHAHVDIVAWGLINIEVKYSSQKNGVYSFITTPSQRRDGFRAHIVVLMCDTENGVTFHLFDSNDPVFFMDGHMKSAVTYAPHVKDHKHEENRVVLTKERMEAAQDRWEMIEEYRRLLSKMLTKVNLA